MDDDYCWLLSKILHWEEKDRCMREHYLVFFYRALFLRQARLERKGFVRELICRRLSSGMKDVSLPMWWRDTTTMPGHPP